MTFLALPLRVIPLLLWFCARSRIALALYRVFALAPAAWAAKPWGDLGRQARVGPCHNEFAHLLYWSSSAGGADGGGGGGGGGGGYQFAVLSIEKRSKKEIEMRK